MRNVLVFIAVGVFGTVALADEWRTPTEADYPSANGRYVAHVTPARDAQKPRLDVFELRATERIARWSCELANQVAPVEVYLSDDGRCVATCNEWHKVGYGDSVLAFYGKQGLIASYSMEQVLHLSPDLKPVDLWGLIPHSVSSRWWDRISIKFFDSQAGKLRFCIWLHLFVRWTTWDPSTGREVVVDDTMTQRCNAKARRWALEQIEAKQGGDCPYEFLGKLRNPEDRPLIELLLSDARFGGVRQRTVQLPSSGTGPAKQRLESYEASSSNRSLAERILAQWDRKDGKSGTSYLGRVEGTVRLPRTADPKQATLWVCLVPITVAKDQWHAAAPVHRLVAPFGDAVFERVEMGYTEMFPFAISTVTPGQYWVKAALDKTTPLSTMLLRTYVPRPGDYESVDSPVMTVRAGGTQHASIDCTHRVANGTD
ncbi:MAG: hypothetical protein JW993_09160 [Sedimentisphaerales bacterium]|nr:hypothetical protein [Sedimentisphaerales bacterium]